MCDPWIEMLLVFFTLANTFARNFKTKCVTFSYNMREVWFMGFLLLFFCAGHSYCLLQTLGMKNNDDALV